MQQSHCLNGDLKSKHKRSTNRYHDDPDQRHCGQAPIVWNSRRLVCGLTHRRKIKAESKIINFKWVTNQPWMPFVAEYLCCNISVYIENKIFIDMSKNCWIAGWVVNRGVWSGSTLFSSACLPFCLSVRLLRVNTMHSFPTFLQTYLCSNNRTENGAF